MQTHWRESGGEEFRTIGDLENVGFEERLKEVGVVSAPSTEEGQGEHNMITSTGHRAAVKQYSPHLCWLRWYVTGSALVKLSKGTGHWIEVLRLLELLTVGMLVGNSVNVFDSFRSRVVE